MEAPALMVDNYAIEINGNGYAMETIYMGSIDAHEEVVPFILVTMIDRL